MSSYQQATGKTIEQAFTEYHEEHPEVFVQFKKYLRDILIAECKKRKFHHLNTIKEKKHSKFIHSSEG